MGKALVIQGLSVPNPIDRVTIIEEMTPEKILARYYGFVPSATSTEKEAVADFVGTMIEKNLWDKIDYLMPMLGTTSNEQVAEAKSNVGIVSVNQSNYLVEDRMLVFNDSIETRSTDTLLSNEYTIICGVKYKDTPFANTRIISIVDDGNSKQVNLSAGTTGYICPRIEVNGVQSSAIRDTPLGTRFTATNDRIIEYSIGQNKSYIYFNGEELTNIEASNTTPHSSTRISAVFNKSTSGICYATFLCIAKALSESEIKTFNDAVSQYLVKVGKLVI